MEVFVPPNNNERIHTRFLSHDDIQKAHQFYERFVFHKDRLKFFIGILEQQKLIFNNTNLIHISQFRH
jgi:hypothetical protein